MEKQSASNSKIKYFLLSILFSILFILTALNISTPITAYAEDDGSEDMDLGDGSVSWGGSVDAEGMDYIYIPGKIYWGGSDTRTGLLFYCVDTETGDIIENTITILYNSNLDNNGEDWRPQVNAHYGSTRVGGKTTYNMQAKLNTSIPNTGAWENTDGSPIKAWLEGDSGSTLPNGEPLPMYARLVYEYCGGQPVLEKVIHQEYTVCFEGMYGMAIYTRKDGLDVARGYGEYYARNHYPELFDENGEAIDETEVAQKCIIKYFTTLRCLSQVYNNLRVDITQRYGDNGTANYKWIQSSSRYFRTAEEHFGIPAASSAGTEITADEIKTTGWNFAVLTMKLPPIHTYDESKGTPGNTQTPDPDNGTDGPCTIRKLYYTEKIASDGTIIEEATDYHWYEQTGTTAYISIDAEEGYEIEGWKASSTNRSLRQKSDYAAVHPIIHSGDSAQEILLDKDNGEKYLYIIYKKTEIEENPPQEWDFRLEQSQITKRVTFLEGAGPANTPSLVAHAFTWTAPAPSKTSCTSHGGNGHHLNCSTVWDEEPRAASGTPGTPGYDAGSSGVRHSHSNSCYDTPCTSWKWTDNTTKLGITLDTSSINKAVVSKNWSITYNATTVNTITSSNKYYKENTSTRSGTGANTQSLSQFNFITVLFRGQDHLTLADWKNPAAPKTYLTSLAYDSAYNFKSANTPQGTRKSGTEYTENFTAKFVNRSPDASTTYKATVGAYGICSVTSSNYSFNDAYTIPNIKVNIQVFWAQGVSPSASGTLPSTQTAGQATFYPYIRMRYDNNTQQDKKVYVLGQNTRTVTFYDYASVGISGGDKELTINSNQWSTHSDAMNNILSKFSSRTLSTTEENRVKSSVLPGGATLSLSVNSSNTRQIVVTTIQAYLTGSGKTQVDVTGGTSASSLPTDITQLESIHTGLVSSVSGVASQAYIAQYICTGAKLNSSEMTGAQFVKAGDTFNGNGTTFSVDTKYHFNRYTDSKLNTHVNSPDYYTYTFYTDTMGNIRCSKNNTSPSETEGKPICTKGSNTFINPFTGDDYTRVSEIINKTGVVLALRKGLVDNEGDDPEAPWAPDGKWYNEAFDGVTYLYAVSTIDIGIWDPLERNTVLDPKTTPNQSNKGDFFTEFNSSFFRSMISGGPTVNVGTFVNSNGKSRALSLNFGELYESKVFYIPNVTTQDLK